MRPLAYTRADSPDTAVASIARGGRPLAGGTDLLALLKTGVTSADVVVDIKAAALPRAIDATDTGVTIGALATIADIAASPVLAECYPLLVQAAAGTATRQIRNRATLGGNLLQRPRCWYFRDRDVPCWLKGGDECFALGGRSQHHAIFGASPCRAVHPSDLAGCLLALDASVVLRGPAGERGLALGDFFAPPEPERRRENVMEPDELIVSVSIPALTPDWRTVYVKAMDRKAWAFALAGVALAVGKTDGRIDAARVVLTGVAAVPCRHAAAEARIVGSRGSEAAGPAGEAIAAGADPLADNRYKVALAGRLLRRALESV